MFFSRAFAVAAALLPLSAVASTAAKRDSCPSDASSYCPSVCTPDADTQLSLFKAFTNQLFTGNVSDAFATYVSPSITEHSATGSSFSDDVSFLSALFPTVTTTVISDIEFCSDSICIVHYEATPNSDEFINNVTAITDIYRFDGSCIVEHWDSIETADASTTNPQFPN